MTDMQTATLMGFLVVLLAGGGYGHALGHVQGMRRGVEEWADILQRRDERARKEASRG